MLIGPFTQLLTMDNLPLGGPLSDSELDVIPNAAVLVEDGIIAAVGDFDELRADGHPVTEVGLPAIALPGLIDAHTHLCCAGSRAYDYALRLAGCTYQEIAEQGGGILDTVRRTRAATLDDLTELTSDRCQFLLSNGVTTCEVKSGYGLTVQDEVKMLEAIHAVDKQQPIRLIATCLAAHTRPWEFSTNEEYLQHIRDDLFPILKERQLANRIDIFVEDNAFTVEQARDYLVAARAEGFELTIHGDQFSRGGAKLAADLQVQSVDHLECSDEQDAMALAEAGVSAVVLPGATLGLGMEHAHARMLLDAGVSLAIASDWNPGSAPMGDLLVQAALLGAAKKLTTAETLAGVTVRAAAALGLSDCGILAPGMRADLTVFECPRYQEILYCQGRLKPSSVFIEGRQVLAR